MSTLVSLSGRCGTMSVTVRKGPFKQDEVRLSVLDSEGKPVAASMPLSELIRILERHHERRRKTTEELVP